MTLKSAEQGVDYIVKRVSTEDDELNSFLFSLGCYEGQPITVINRLKGSMVVAIKESRYSIDYNLADCIEV